MDCLVGLKARLPAFIRRTRGFGLSGESSGGKGKEGVLGGAFCFRRKPFRVLIDLVRKREKKGRRSIDHVMKGAKRVIFVDVDAILFEHMLWLMQNDDSSLFELNLKEIIDFYAQDF